MWIAMRGADPDVSLPATAHWTAPPAPPHRDEARIRVDFTEREARSVIRATTLVTEILRPELFRHGRSASASPLVTAYQVLVAACERCGVDLGPCPSFDAGAAQDND